MGVQHIVPILSGLITMVAIGAAQLHQHVEDFEFVCNGAHISIDVPCGDGATQSATSVNNQDSEWNLVFKVVSGVAPPGSTDPLLSDPLALWNRDAPYNEDIPAARQLDTSFRGHYKSSFALNWERRNIYEVKFALLDNTGTELISMIFDGSEANSTSWFSKERLLTFPYEDLLIEPQNFFSIVGEHGRSTRRWYVNRNYGGCPADNGWLGVLTETGVCDWEMDQDESKPNFLYSLKKTYANWNNSEDIGIASIMAIFVKTR